MSGNISGVGAKMQIGAQSTWGTTADTPTNQIEFTSESLGLQKNYIESDALLGNVTTNRLDPAGQKIEGNVAMICHPDQIGLLLSAALGSESAVGNVGSGIYAHSFSCLPAGSSYSLPKLVVLVDRVKRVVELPANKIAQLELSAKINDYLRANLSIRGIGESDSEGSLESLSFSTLRPFQFRDLAITLDGSSTLEVSDFKLTINNNLENDRYTAGASAEYMRELEPGKREIMLDLEMIYDDDSSGLRETNFKVGTSVAVVATFTSTEEVVESSGVYYSMQISIPLGYVMEANVGVGGPERLKIPIRIKAAQGSATEPITIILVDAESSKYIT
jgi:hypothetical protein